jgi:hypothetical protein
MYSLLYFSSIVKHSNRIVVLQHESQAKSFHNSYAFEKPLDAVVATVEEQVPDNDDTSKSLSATATPIETPVTMQQEEMFGDERELQLNER